MPSSTLVTTSLDLGAARITSIVEQTLHGLSGLLPDATPQAVAQIDWLKPHWVSEAGEMLGVIQAFIIEIAGKLIVVDPCVGNDKTLPISRDWRGASFDFLDRFRANGFDPDRVDLVLCTHMHVDHVGWNTLWDGKAWQPTFPNARHLFDRTEFGHWTAHANAAPVEIPPGLAPAAKGAALFSLSQQHVHHESIQPIVDSGLADLIDPPAEIAPGVTLIPTPGHTPGHVSIEINSEGKRALITGDSFHHPCQIARPHWSSGVDFDRNASAVTRRRILETLENKDDLMIGTHFAAPWAGRIVASDNGHVLEPEAQPQTP